MSKDKITKNNSK